MESTRTYRTTDESRSTHASNYGRRTHLALGVCVHTTSGRNSLAFLQSDRRLSTGVSCADCLIDRSGERHDLIPEGRFAYHVGKGTWDSITNDNDGLAQRWLGVELEQEKLQLCTWEQLDSLAEYVVISGSRRGWRFPYTIVGHYELARPYGRRSDPQGFDWGHFMGFLIARARLANVAGL